MIIFSEGEKTIIAALSVAGGWEDAQAQPIKTRIKPLLLKQTSNCCCYCRRSMHKWHGLTIDIEHVLPKGAGKFPQFTFEARNLSVSCKRCNMGIKGSDISFYLGNVGELNPFKSECYKLVHPNLDVADDHLGIVAIQVNGKCVIKYQIINASGKGAETYEYFQLKELEINSFDNAQGLEHVSPSDTLPLQFSRELKAVLERFDVPK